VFTARDGWWKRTDEIYEAVRIGEGMAATGALGAEPIERGLHTVELFSHFCRATGLAEGDVHAVATSAIRSASQRDEFLERALERSGLRIRVLSEEEEARYGYLAAVNSTTLTDGAVLDLGGGSMQLVRVKGRRAKGAVVVAARRRAHDRALPARRPAARSKQLKALRAHVLRAARGRAVAAPRRRADRRHRRHGTQPGHRSAVRGRSAHLRRAGLHDHARRA
jgi:exopolyphosphatase/guanosine-5'-triphosphate,3'-diphosphate pyrophosphatase